MKILDWIFGKKEDVNTGASPFSIEYYPLTNRYYPRYYDYYMQKNYVTGIMEKLAPRHLMYADYGETEEQAEKIIEIFKEHLLKVNVKVIKK